MCYVTDRDLLGKLARFCRDKRLRTVGRELKGYPCRWYPNEVVDPQTGEVFTEAGAWEHIASLIEDGHAIKEVQMRKLSGKTAFEIIEYKEELEKDLYIKIIKIPAMVVGISFHYSDIEDYFFDHRNAD